MFNADNISIEELKNVIKQKKNTRRILVALIAIVAVVVCIFIFSDKTYSNDEEFAAFADSQLKSSFYPVASSKETSSSYKYDEAFSTAVEYDSNMNDEILKKGKTAVASNVKAAKKKAASGEKTAVLTKCCSSSGSKGVTSLIVFSAVYTLEGNEMCHTKDYVQTFLFNSKNSHPAVSEQILNDDYREIISEPAMKKVKKKNSKKNLAKDWKDYFTPETNHFNTFIFSDNKIIFYIPCGKDGKFVSCELSLDKISGITRDKFIERYIGPNTKIVAITYDDGPGGKSEDRILDAYEKYDDVATFFYLGSRVADNKDNVSRAFSLGCEIGNHSWNHPYLTQLKSKDIKRQIARTNKVIKSVTGQEPTVFRPCYGLYNSKVLKSADMPAFMWEVDSRDWESKNAKSVMKIIKSSGNLDGKIILMHSIYDSTAEATEKLLPWLQENGYQTVTLTELIKYRDGDQLEKGKLYF